MEITIIHGQGHYGSTYHISKLMREQLGGKDATVREYFLPKDGPGFCVGCFNCITKDEKLCPQADKTQEIVESMISSDVIIIDSPTYCMEMTGQLKTLFDHLGYMWLAHRPRKEMFLKMGIAISTTAGAGARKVTKSIARHMFWWGIPKVYRIHFSVQAMGWDGVKDKIKKRISRRVDSVARKVKSGRTRHNFSLRFMFNMFRKMNMTPKPWNPADREYWERNGWLGQGRPWNKKSK